MSVRMGLLALLSEGPNHGYQLKASFEARTGGVWTVNVGQVYTTLDRLRSDGLVEPADLLDDEPGGTRDKRRWRITPMGKAELEEWFDTADLNTVPPRDELLVKVLLAFGRSPADAMRVIDQQRTELFRLAQAQRRARSRAASADDHRPGEIDPLPQLAAELMAEAIAARQEADLQWLNHCESVILATEKRRTP